MKTAPHETGLEAPVGVLLVDDEPNVLKALRRLLIEEECQVFTATSGRQGLEILEQHKNVGVIISDQKMPEMTGVEFLEHSRKVAPYAMKIMLTGYADIHATADAINKGRAHRYMTKPWDDQELLGVVRSAVDTYLVIMKNRKLEEEEKQEKKKLQDLNRQLREIVKQQQEKLQGRSEPGQGSHQGESAAFSRCLFPVLDLLESRKGMQAAHGRFVAAIAGELSREMGLPAREIEAITMASLLHDIGKIGTPDRLLGKRTDEMTEEEFLEYQLHPIRSQRTIESMEGMNGVGRLVRHHHEAFDGSGFPDRLTAEGIPLGSRIISLSDFVSRFLRFLHEEKERNRLLRSVESRLRKQFDPKLCPYLANLLEDETSRRVMLHGKQVKEMSGDDLVEGMELAQDLRTKSGGLLLKRGSCVNQGALQAFEQHCQQETVIPKVFVYIQDDLSL